MKTTTFSWLHLTDLHFGMKDQNFLWPNLRQPFFDDLVALHDLTGPWQAVLFTGDLVQQGKSEEFKAMQKEVLARLWEQLSKLGSGDAVLLAVPGNHDLYRPDLSDNAPADTLLDDGGFDRIAEKFWNNPTGAYRRVVDDAFVAYSEWWREYQPKNLTNGIIPGDFSYSLNYEERRIGIVGLNTAFLQLGEGNYKGKLNWNARQLNAVCNGAADDWVKQHEVCLLLSHHGPDWLTPAARKHGEREIAPAGRFAVHFFGHAHEPIIQYVYTGGNSNPIRLCQGNSVFGMELLGEPPTLTRSHGYSAGQIRFGEGPPKLRIWPRFASDKTGLWRFVPDVEHAHLQGDHGTNPESLACHTPSSAVTTNMGNSRRPSIVIPTNKSAPYSTLPVHRSFFGREEELARIAQFLRPDRRSWGVVLDGPGGIGKTSLALEAAHRAPPEHFPLKLFITAKTCRLDPDGEYTFQNNQVQNYTALVTAIGLALGHDEIQRAPEDQRTDLVIRALKMHRLLLVLDNLETFTLDERERTYELLDDLSLGSKAIVTSRLRNQTAATHHLRLEKLGYEAAKQMLTALGERISIGKLNPDEQHILYTETGGNPLLLTWVASQLGRKHGCPTVKAAVQRLHEAHLQQQNEKKNDPLEFIFGDLLNTFTNDETAVLAALTYFREPARLSWLLPIADLSEANAQAAVDDLKNRAVLIEDQASETLLLPPLCSHFLCTRRAKEVGAAGRRLEAKAYAMVVQHGGDDTNSYADLKLAWPTIQAALPLLVTGSNARLQEVCDALNQFLDFTGRWDVRLGLSQDAEAKALTAGEYDNAGWRAYQAGRIHILRREANAVMACASRCAEHWGRGNTDMHKRALTIRLQGSGFQLMGQLPSAIAAFQQALELDCSVNPNSEDVVADLIGLAAAKMLAGDLNGAKTNRSDALRIAKKINHPQSIAVASANLAKLHLAQEDWSTAEGLSNDALALAINVGRDQLLAFSHHCLAEALLHQNRINEALPHAREAKEIYTWLRHHDLAEATATLVACESAYQEM